MNQILDNNKQNMNQILDREHISNEIKQFLKNFDSKCKTVTFKKGIYLFGSPGSCKTQFIVNILK